MAGFLPTRIPGDGSNTLELPQQFNPAAPPWQSPQGANTLELPQQFTRPAPGMAPPFGPQRIAAGGPSTSNLPWRQGGVYGTLSHIESGQHNILSQVDRGSAQERSQGYFQIKTSTLRRYGQQAGIDPRMLTRAMDMSPAMQQRVVSQIPLREFGPRTQALMRQKYGALFNPNMTVGQLASMLGEGTAYAEEPTAGMPAMRVMPSQTGMPVNMAKLRANIANLPPDRQQRILARAQGMNRDLAQNSMDPAIHEGLAKYGEVYRTGPGDTGAIPDDQTHPYRREDIETDIRHPSYAPWRRFGTRVAGHALDPFITEKGHFAPTWEEKVDELVGIRPPPPETYATGGMTPEEIQRLQSQVGHIVFPQTPTQAALTAATLPMGWAEMAPELPAEERAALGGWRGVAQALRGERPALKGVQAARQAVKPWVATAPRRVALMAGVGAGAAKATGDPVSSGVGQGLAYQGPGEAAGALAGLGGRLIGKAHLLRQTTRDVSSVIGSVLPANPDTNQPFTLDDWKTPDRAFAKVQQALRPTRDWVYRQMAGKKFLMPVVKGANPDKWGIKIKPKGLPAEYHWIEVPLKDAEEALSKMGDKAWAKTATAEPKYAGEARDIRKIADERLNYVARRMPLNVRRAWLQVRHMSAAGSAIERLMKGEAVGREAIDPVTGLIDQPRLAKGINEHMDDLRRQLGPGAADRLWKAVTRADPRGWLYRGSPYPGAWKDQPAHWKPHLNLHPGLGEIHPGIYGILPESYKPIGNVPIWMYPPRAPFALGAGQYVTSGEQSLRPPPQQTDQEGQ